MTNKIKKAFLVYQAGLANVFAVDTFNLADADQRQARRLMQNAFGPCQHFARGLAAAGVVVRTATCNQAGDIANAHWTEDLESQPFADQLVVIDEN